MLYPGTASRGEPQVEARVNAVASRTTAVTPLSSSKRFIKCVGLFTFHPIVNVDPVRSTCIGLSWYFYLQITKLGCHPYAFPTDVPGPDNRLVDMDASLKVEANTPPPSLLGQPYNMERSLKTKICCPPVTNSFFGTSLNETMTNVRPNRLPFVR